MRDSEVREAAAAPGAAGAGRVVPAGGGDGSGGGGWTVLVPAAAAAEWTALTVASGRAAARAGDATGASGEGGGGCRVPEMAIEMAALLGAPSGTGARALGEGFTERVGAGGGMDGVRGQGGELLGRGAEEECLDLGAPAARLCRTSCPIVFVPNINTKEADPKEKWLDVVQIIFGLLLFGTLGFVSPMRDALHARHMNDAFLWPCFAIIWGLLSVGFHIGLGGQIHRLGRVYTQFIAHLSLVLFCSLVVFYLYLLLPRGILPMSWIVEVEFFLIAAHIAAWYWAVKDTVVTPKVVSLESASAPGRSSDETRGDIETGSLNLTANDGTLDRTSNDGSLDRTANDGATMVKKE